jgi:hypothetical protein
MSTWFCCELGRSSTFILLMTNSVGNCSHGPHTSGLDTGCVMCSHGRCNGCRTEEHCAVQCPQDGDKDFRWTCCQCFGDNSTLFDEGCTNCLNHWKCGCCAVYEVSRKKSWSDRRDLSLNGYFGTPESTPQCVANSSTLR